MDDGVLLGLLGKEQPEVAKKVVKISFNISDPKQKAKEELKERLLKELKDLGRK